MVLLASHISGAVIIDGGKDCKQTYVSHVFLPSCGNFLFFFLCCLMVTQLPAIGLKVQTNSQQLIDCMTSQLVRTVVQGTFPTC